MAAISVAIGVGTNALRSEPLQWKELKQPFEASDLANPDLKTFAAFVESGSGIVLDVRVEPLYLIGHVPGAINLPSKTLRSDRVLLESDLGTAGTPDAPWIVVYCDGPHCPASRQVQTQLWQLGYTRVGVFKGGWEAWQSAGMSVARDR